MRKKRTTWTSAQDEVIRELYPLMSAKELALLMKVDYTSLCNHIHILDLWKKERVLWSEEDLQAIRERYPTEGPEALSKELNRGYWAVVGKASELGIATRKPPPDNFEWTPEMDQMLLERYATDGGDALADELGLSLETIRHKANVLGLKTNFGHKRWGRERAETNDSCDIRFFDAWSSDMAYVLGFLFADGNVNKELTAIAVCLSSRDECVLDYIKRVTKSRHKIREIKARVDPRTGETHRPQCGLTLSSRVLVEGAMRRGLKPRKTYTDERFPDVPDDMLPHLSRGLLDGDGHVSLSNNGACHVGFLGSVRFATELCQRLSEAVGIKTPRIYITGDDVQLAHFGWGAFKDLRKLRDFLYPNQDLFCLARKRDKLDQWLAKPRVQVGKRWVYQQPEEGNL